MEATTLMSISEKSLRDSPGFIGLASFTKTGLFIDEYGVKSIRNEVSGICPVLMQVRSSFSSSLTNESISLTIETTKRKTIAVESKDIILVLCNSTENPKVNRALDI
ncbi:hypothetical protein FG379_003137 [Cryptosporidium bovis]|uniref:uncharacterized protein n=1 Tax=Cryptosporidium bovis TaxID=310047 RepID=UPI00351A7189|nr:hypothetical protein FG379_003137 [Cryptosporidium bovis]